MNTARGALPTLTEVIEVEDTNRVAPGFETTEVAPFGLDVGVGTTEAPPGKGDTDGTLEALVDHVLAAIGPRIDALLEARLREIVAPTVLRQVNTAMNAVRAELSAELRAATQQALDADRAGRRGL